ncbi:tetratricopeptide repeat protein [Clostridium chauvoei]|uniref:tetratricopeptide repeat protein n=1 Tax=Clostridium chauvoei TaxID=46867 RepID=UPI001C85FEDA|nr:tetratricopeptide repeat protein [Clostridium chauvoei]MBX7347672.1 tetratricopeptide repeat protein [Clostridium chauvoei]
MDYFNEGNKFYNLKDYKNAISCYKKSIDKYDNTACSFYNCGVCYIKLKDFDNAISMIKGALEIQKESKYFFNIAYCYAMKQESNKALIYFNIAWSLDDSDIDCEKAINLIISKKKKAL